MKKTGGISWMILMLIFWQCAADRHMVLLEKRETTVAMRAGSSFKVKIPFQSGTGYDWNLDKGASRIEEISSAVHKPHDGKTGGQATRIFTLHTTKAMGEDRLKFNLSRSFEKESATETRILNVIIKP